jgi:hypothetical protein
MKFFYQIQYASNLFVHQNQNLKQATQFLEKTQAPNLALLGNIGFPANPKTKEFIQWCCANWLKVYWVPGPTELHHQHQINSFRNTYDNLKNLHILDHSEHKLTYAPLSIIGVPLWVPSRGKWHPQLNEKEQFFFTNKSNTIIDNWHQEDLQYIKEKVNHYSQDIFENKVLLLTHHLPSSHLLPDDSTNRDHYLFAGNGEILRMPNLLGCLSGAGKTTKSGFFGSQKLFCAVNAAFSCPDMVPNPSYSPSQVATFSVSTNWYEPKGYGTSRLGILEKFYPIPSVAYQLQ